MTKSYRSQAEISALLQALEREHRLLEHRVQGWSVWPLFRFSVFRAIQELPLDHQRLSLSRREILEFAVRDLVGFATAKRSPWAIKTFSTAHAEFGQAGRKDVYFDDVVMSLGGCFKIETLNNPSIARDRRPALVPRNITTQAIELLAARIKGSQSTEISVAASAISEVLQAKLGLKSFTPTRVASTISRFVHRKRIYRAVLRRSGARVLMLADTGDYSITAAARELGMRVVEFQHGRTDRHHPSSSWSADALPHKNTMPLPHRVFVYGPHWQRELEANGFWRTEVRPVGSTRLDQYRARSTRKDNDLCSIVVTAQGTDTARLIDFLVDCVSMLDGRIRYQLDIKMHPFYHGELKPFEAAFGSRSNVRLIAGGDSPSTFELLQSAHFHASIFSTCHYEALGLGVPTIILPLTGSENVRHLCESGHASMPASPEEFVHCIVENSIGRVNDDVAATYFTPNALQNTLRELRTLLTEAA